MSHAKPKPALPPRKKKKPCRPGFCFGSWLIGLIMGAGSFWLIQITDFDLQAWLRDDRPPVVADTVEPPKDDPLDNIEITFYKLLPNMEQEYSYHRITEQIQEESPEKPLEKPDLFRLQAGSFQRMEDADRRRAQILLLGLDTHIQKVTVQDVTWNRVMLGPFKSLKHLAAARHQLSENGIDTIITKMKAPAQ